MLVSNGDYRSLTSSKMIAFKKSELNIVNVNKIQGCTLNIFGTHSILLFIWKEIRRILGCVIDCYMRYLAL